MASGTYKICNGLVELVESAESKDGGRSDGCREEMHETQSGCCRESAGTGALTRSRHSTSITCSYDGKELSSNSHFFHLVIYPNMVLVK